LARQDLKHKNDSIQIRVHKGGSFPTSASARLPDFEEQADIKIRLSNMQSGHLQAHDKLGEVITTLQSRLSNLRQNLQAVV